MIQSNISGSSRLDHRVKFQDTFSTTVGGHVTLNISVIANPAPTFNWYRLANGKKTNLRSNNPVNKTDVSAVGSYVISKVKMEHIGTYQVVVSNGAPRPTLVVNLTLTLQGIAKNSIFKYTPFDIVIQFNIRLSGHRHTIKYNKTVKAPHAAHTLIFQVTPLVELFFKELLFRTKPNLI